MTTGGEGGMVTTNDTALWKKMWALKDHGKSWDAVYEREHAPGFRWLHESFGTNWRMTEMQAAIGRIQTQRMPEWNKQRLANANNKNRDSPHILVPIFYMSRAFFKALDIPEADVNLGIGSGSHAEQVGHTMIAFEKLLRRERPDCGICQHSCRV